MSSEVETSLDARSSRSRPRFLDSAGDDKSIEATQLLFTGLTVYRNGTPHSAAMNMAIDEALLEYATEPLIRFYRWQSLALSFGYFGRFADVAHYQRERDLVRRWTGGGIVFHGDDLTYSIVIPAVDAAFAESSMSIYETIHRGLVDALIETGQPAVVAGVGGPGPSSVTIATRTGISDAGYSCFENPMRADVIIDGRKVAGAAQRRTGRGLLQQGSIQGIDLQNDFAQRFTQALSADCSEGTLDGEILHRARELADQKYGAECWLRKR
jgi:lipoate-protein ligase A